MLDFVTIGQLETMGRSISESTVLAKAVKSEGKNVFLSHSSKDARLLPPVIKLLEDHGGQVYVDLKDDALPRNPSPETARILRENLSKCRKLILFVTTQSKDSRWIPWELGLGDGQKRPANVALLPAANTSNDKAWAEVEFLGLYDRIIWGNFPSQSPEWLVHNHRDNTALRLREWIQRS